MLSFSRFLCRPFSNSAIRVLKQGGIAKITLASPKTRNALSLEMLGSIGDVLEELKTDGESKVVVFEAEGSVFSSGHNIKEMEALVASGEDLTDLFKQCSSVMRSIQSLPQPAIAKVRGVATAAGLQLAAACDICIAEKGARFSTPGVHIGLFCTTPAVTIARRINSQAMLAMLFTGDMVDAATAQRIGLVWDIVPEEELDDAVDRLAQKIASKSATALAIGKRAFYEQIQMPIEGAYDYASVVMGKNIQRKDTMEGLQAFLQKRTPVWSERDSDWENDVA